MFNDRSAQYNNTAINEPSFIGNSVTGDRSSLQLLSSSQQFLMSISRGISFGNRSWTIEGWIYPRKINESGDHGIFGQCNVSSNYSCLNIMIRNGKIHVGFFGDGLTGYIVLKVGTWYHFAIVFDCATRLRSIFLNGILDRQNVSRHCYQRGSAPITIGTVQLNPPRYFDGLIDQITVTNRTKSSDEILDDATLTLYLPFNNGSIVDEGPLELQISVTGSLHPSMFSLGKKGIIIGPNKPSYILASGSLPFYFGNASFSFTIWLYPIYINATSTILQLSAQGIYVANICISVLSLDTVGQLLVFSEPLFGQTLLGPRISPTTSTHVAITYSPFRGFKLFVNGKFYSQKLSTIPAIISQITGFYIGFNGCSVANNSSNQYYGGMDEIRAYSRELSDCEILRLTRTSTL